MHSFRILLFLGAVFICAVFLLSYRLPGLHAGVPTFNGKPGNAVGQECMHPRDGAMLVWVPGGSFRMGNPAWEGNGSETPEHTVTLTGYWLYKYEVTVAQYLKFCRATHRALPKWPGEQYSWRGKKGWGDRSLQQHPIVNVNWPDAKAYTDWAGVRLPTEAQWEYAARGPEGRNYPWGGRALPENATAATKADPYNGWDQTKCANGYNSEHAGKGTWPVGSFPEGASWCGAQDLAGNAWEWCMDWYAGYSAAPVTNPTGIETEAGQVLRGGSWYYTNKNFFRGANRQYGYYPAGWSTSFGFRCVALPTIE